MRRLLKRKFLAVSLIAILILFLALFKFNPFLILGQIGKSLPHTVLEIPEKYKVVGPGDDLVIQLRLFNFESKKKIDVVIDYEIKDEKGEIILTQHETVAVETQASFLKTFVLPSDLETGHYSVYTRLKSLDESVNFSTASASFEVSEDKSPYIKSVLAWKFSKTHFISVSLVILILILGFFFTSSIKAKGQGEKIAICTKKADYVDLISAIVDSNYFFLGEKALGEANKISGLTVSKNGKVVELREEPQDIILRLVNLYRISLGEGSINIAKEAIQPILKNNPQLEVPF